MDNPSSFACRSSVVIRPLGRVEYEPTWRAMQAFTAARTADTPDEICLVEHPPVYTLGQAGKPEHLLKETGIPLVKIDRGGQITYHGPGQAVIYLLLDLRRNGIKVRELVALMETAIIDFLSARGIVAQRKEGAPGVYVAGEKVAALGLRVKNGCSYHGLSLNVRMDLTPFDWINPCGYPGLKATQLSDLGLEMSLTQAQQGLAEQLLALIRQHSKPGGGT